MDGDEGYVADTRTRACKVYALPCWHPSRRTMRISEVPLYLKRMHNVTVSYAAVLGWAKKGIIAKNDGKRVYLRVSRMGRWRIVAKSDIMAFMAVETEEYERKYPIWLHPNKKQNDSDAPASTS